MHNVRKRNIVLFYFIMGSIGTGYIILCFFTGNKKMDAREVGTAGLFFFFLLWGIINFRQKSREKQRARKMYQEKNMDLYIQYHDRIRVNSTEEKVKEYETVQVAIGYAYKGNLAKAEEMLESLRNGQGCFSEFIEKNAVINLYIIYLYQENLQKARNFYRKNEKIFKKAMASQKGFTVWLWQAYEDVLENKYESARKKLGKIPEGTAKKNDLYKMLMSEILLESGQLDEANEYMTECLNTVMFPFMRNKVEKLKLRCINLIKY